MSVISPLVEGEMDEAAAFKLIDAAGHTPEYATVKRVSVT